ncbi:unnamed protein product [Polarella glacialis]|uniref:Transmembrane protein n=1 Tax=Polarella glacialis TaxID=89957 RepID=A0A813FUB0_POLGL|nr:unnamed protein product [Polarella glacialis]
MALAGLGPEVLRGNRPLRRQTVLLLLLGLAAAGAGDGPAMDQEFASDGDGDGDSAEGATPLLKSSSRPVTESPSSQWNSAKEALPMRTKEEESSSGEELPSSRSSRPSTEAAAEELLGQEAFHQSSKALPDTSSGCPCGQSGCPCDLSAVKDLNQLLKPLGYDRCVDDGPCEMCGEFERLVAHCSTGQRQKVVCGRCSSPDSRLPFCLPGYRIFWSANRSSGPEEEQTALLPVDHENTTALGARRNPRLRAVAGPSAGVFYRSCGSKAAVERTESAASAALRPQAVLGDGSAEVFYFLAANAVVLALSAWSLWRQQREQWEQTMKGLYSSVGNAELPVASANAASAQKGAQNGAALLQCSAVATSSDWARKASERRPGVSEPGAKPDSIGRSIESVVSGAMSLTKSTAIEFAVMGQGTSSQKLK